MQDSLRLLVHDLVSEVVNVLIGMMRRYVLIRRRSCTCKCNLMRPIGGLRLVFVGRRYLFLLAFAIMSRFVRVVEEYQSTTLNES